MKTVRIAFAVLIALLLLGIAALAQQYRNAPLVYIEVAETMADDPESREALADFDKALAAAIAKKKAPVTLVTDRSKAQLVMQGITSHSESGRAAAVKTLIFGAGSSANMDVTIRVIDVENSIVAYAYYITIKKGNFKSAAENFANRFKKDLQAKR